MLYEKNLIKLLENTKIDLIATWAYKFAYSFYHSEDKTGCRIQFFMYKQNDDLSDYRTPLLNDFVVYSFCKEEIPEIYKSLNKFINLKAFY